MGYFNPQPKKEKHRSKPYLKFIGRKPCLVDTCGERSVACHVGLDKNTKGWATKVHDCWTLNLCPKHHVDFDAGPTAFQKKHNFSAAKVIIDLMTEWLIFHNHKIER